MKPLSTYKPLKSAAAHTRRPNVTHKKKKASRGSDRAAFATRQNIENPILAATFWKPDIEGWLKMLYLLALHKIPRKYFTSGLVTL